MIKSRSFGLTSNGEEIIEYTLSNSCGNFVKIINYGCVIRCIDVFGVDVCLGFDTLAEYEADTSSFGAVVGRYANRIANAKFKLNGIEYRLAKNNGPNHLHGGLCGFSKRIWDAHVEGEKLILTRVSPDGEENYPGTLTVTVCYSFSDDNALSIHYHAETNQDTILNLTNHAYFNLNGNGTALNHYLTIHADSITENDDHVLPTGKFILVEGTPFDFRNAKPVGKDIQADHIQLQYGKGYDHNFVLSSDPIAAVLTGDQSGITMEVITDRPGVQLYTGNFLRGSTGKNGQIYNARNAVCLETQGFPNSMEHTHFPSPILRAGEIFESTTVYRFSK